MTAKYEDLSIIPKNKAPIGSSVNNFSKADTQNKWGSLLGPFLRNHFSAHIAFTVRSLRKYLHLKASENYTPARPLAPGTTRGGPGGTPQGTPQETPRETPGIDPEREIPSGNPQGAPRVPLGGSPGGSFKEPSKGPPGWINACSGGGRRATGACI